LTLLWLGAYGKLCLSKAIGSGATFGSLGPRLRLPYEVGVRQPYCSNKLGL
jgi:hypothetical protein